MDRAVLSLTRKDVNRQPIGPLIVDMQFIKSLTTEVSLYFFCFDARGNNKLEFMLVGESCTTFFRLLDDISSPNTTIPDPPAIALTTADPNGKPNGKLQVTVAKLKTFPDEISLFSYSFVPDGSPPFEFNLTSTDAGGFVGDFDNILWSNPPNPPH